MREYLSEKGVPPEHVPKFGICPDNKKDMTKAAMQVEENFIDCGPIDNAVACHYFKKTIWHVGIVEGGMVRHTGRQYGTTQHKISEFEKLAPKTIYKIHKSLCRN